MRDDVGFATALARGTSVTLVMRIAGVGLTYLAQVLLARWIGIVEFGAYAWVYNTAWLLSTAAVLGLPSAMPRFVPEYIGRREWRRLRGVMRVSTLLVVATGIALSVLGAGLIYVLGASLETARAAALYLGLALVPLIAISELCTGMLRALRRHAWALGPMWVARPVLLVGGVFAALQIAGTGAARSETLLVSALVAQLTLVVVQFFAIRRALPSAYWSELERTVELGNWLRVALPLLLVAGFLTLLNRVDVLLIGTFIGAQQVGLYAAASRTADLAGFVLMSVNFVVGPTIASLYAAGETQKLRRLLSMTAHWILWPSMVASIGLVVFAGNILGFFGPEFLEGRFLLWILLAGQIVNMATGSVGVVLNMTGHQDHTARVYGTALLVKLGLSAVVIPIGGVTGMAALTACVVAGQNLWLWRLTRRYLGLDTSVLGLSRPGE